MRRRDLVLVTIIGVAVLMCLAVLAGGLADMGAGWRLGGFGGRVGLVEVTGQIKSSDWAVEQIRRFARREDVAAIVIRLDSPGGGVAPSQEIFEEIGKARGNGKKVVASMGSIAASGALYIACGADTVVANPGTLTGSIGVIFQFPVFEGLMDKVGVRLETVRSGEFKDVGNVSRSMTPREEEMLQAVIDDTFDQFVDVVAEGRQIERDSVLSFATGAIFTGQQALDMGLVDILGDYQDAIDIAGEMCDLGPNPPIVRQVQQRKWGFWDLFFGSFLGLKVDLENGLAGPELAYLFTY